MKNRTQLLLLVLATITGSASGSACETLYHGGGCEQCMSAGSYCNYCPKDNKCSNSDLKKYCGCSSTDCYGQDCAVKTCPQKPTPPPTPKPKAAKFVITVEEITNALNHSHEGHPLENLVISKILGVFGKDNITIVGGDITYDFVGPTVIVENDTCKMHVQIDNGWTTKAVLLPDTSVALKFGVGGAGRALPELIIGAAVHFNSSFHVAANIHLAEGSAVIHPKGKPCSLISTENSRETIEGDMNLEVNASLELQPSLAGNLTAGFHLHFTPAVKVAGKLLTFDAKVYSAISVFGINMKKISGLVDTVIDSTLKKEITDKLIQNELTALEVKLQHMANQIWPPADSQGDLPEITPDLVSQMETALRNIRVTQKAHYP